MRKQLGLLRDEFWKNVSKFRAPLDVVNRTELRLVECATCYTLVQPDTHHCGGGIFHGSHQHVGRLHVCEIHSTYLGRLVDRTWRASTYFTFRRSGFQCFIFLDGWTLKIWREWLLEQFPHMMILRKVSFLRQPRKFFFPNFGLPFTLLPRSPFFLY